MLFHSEGIIVSTNNTRSENLTNTVLAMRPAYKVNSALAVLIRFVPLHTLWRTAHNQVVQTSSNITQYILSLIFHFSLTYAILVMHARTQCRSIVVFCGQLCNLAQTPPGSLPFSLHGSPTRLLRLPIPFFCGWSPKHSHSWGGGQWYSVCMSNPPPSCFVFIQIVACEARYRHIIRASDITDPPLRFLFVGQDLNPRRSFYVIHPDWTSEGNSTRFMELGRRRQMAQLTDQRPYHFYHPVNADVERLLALRRKREMERDGAYVAMHQRYAGLTPAERGEPASMQPAWTLPPENIFYRRLATAAHKVNPRYVPFTY